MGYGCHYCRESAPTGLCVANMLSQYLHYALVCRRRPIVFIEQVLCVRVAVSVRSDIWLIAESLQGDRRDIGTDDVQELAEFARRRRRDLRPRNANLIHIEFRNHDLQA